MTIKKHELFTVFFFLFTGVMGLACGSLTSSEDQFTKKIEAPAFVSELYGDSTQTLSVAHSADGHISWMGFVQSQEYSYFEITQVQVGSSTVVKDGSETDGEIFTASSNSIIEDITVGSTSGTSNEYVDGSINLAGGSDLKISVKYSPLKAIDEESEPHVAYLLINYDTPQVGSVRIKIEGYTQGVKSEKCTQDTSTMEMFEYNVVGDAFDLYFCSSEVAKFDQNNTTQDSADPDYHGSSTNLAQIDYPDPIVFYKVDDETVCVLSESDPSTIPGFTLPIPEGLAPIDTMDISLVDGSYAECTLDGDQNIFCDSNIQIDALVSLSGFSMGNQTFAAEDLVTDDCPDFGEISGSGLFGEDSMNLILTGYTLSDQNTQEYNIVDSLIVAEIPLEK